MTRLINSIGYENYRTNKNLNDGMRVIGVIRRKIKQKKTTKKYRQKTDSRYYYHMRFD